MDEKHANSSAILLHCVKVHDGVVQRFMSSLRRSPNTALGVSKTPWNFLRPQWVPHAILECPFQFTSFQVQY